MLFRDLQPGSLDPDEAPKPRPAREKRSAPAARPAVAPGHRPRNGEGAAPVIARLPAPEPVSWEELFTHRGFLRKLLTGLMGDPVLAEDLTQDTLLVAWLQPPDGDRPVRPWLATVARNLAFKHWRTESRRRRREERLQRETADRGHGRAGEPSEQLAWEDLRADVLRAVDDLPEPYRATIRLSFVEGLSCVDIGRRLGVQADTVNKRKQRALHRLRTRLDGRYGRNAWAPALLGLGVPGNLPEGLGGGCGAAVSAKSGDGRWSARLATLGNVRIAATFLIGAATLGMAVSGGPGRPPASEQARDVVLSGERQTASQAPAPVFLEGGSARSPGRRTAPAAPPRAPRYVPEPIDLRVRMPDGELLDGRATFGPESEPTGRD